MNIGENLEKIMNVPINAVSMEQSLNIIKNTINNKDKLHIITINAEMIMLSKENEEFKNILNEAELLIPDGSGVVWALRQQGIKVKKLPGIELSQNCISQLDKNVYLLGANNEVITSAYQNLKTKFPNSKIVGYHDGYFKENQEEEIINEINSLNTDILLVGLGVPRQEKWIRANLNKVNASVFIGVGGSFDVFSGKIKRAPNIMIKFHLEWLYRLYKEPWRWKRMLALPKFVGAVYTYKK
jgi:N-acetylglucosaminyldiphosphoundecaprenol N-acetyl-beta-D-mannosaminyltransferase